MLVSSGMVTSETKEAALHGMDVLVAVEGWVEAGLVFIGMGVEVLVSVAVGVSLTDAMAVMVSAACVKINSSSSCPELDGKLQAVNNKIRIKINVDALFRMAISFGDYSLTDHAA